MATVTYKMNELVDGRKFSVRGTGPTRVLALAEANTKLAMTVGNVVGNSVSEELTEEEAGDAHAVGQFSDAILILQHSITGVHRSIKLDNIATSLGTGLNGQLNIDDALVTAFAAAYRDGEGNGGYEAFDGYFVA